MIAIQKIHNILTVKKISIGRKTVLLTGQQFIDLLPAIELLTDGLIFICLISHVMSRHRPYSQRCRTSNEYVSGNKSEQETP